MKYCPFSIFIIAVVVWEPHLAKLSYYIIAKLTPLYLIGQKEAPNTSAVVSRRSVFENWLITAKFNKRVEISQKLFKTGI